ncbi:MAG: serine/threonine protein kinase [Planctomycetales bacterium]|nr:serine/threonine protein kinase [Planctomycetales bacterium]
MNRYSTEALDAPTIVGDATNLPHTASESFPQIPGYEILYQLGRGGMGVVYLARHKALDRRVALKTLRGTEDPELANLLLSEAKIAGRLEHPAIVPVYEVNTQRQPWFFSMGYVDGEDLAKKLSRQVMEPRAVGEMGVALAEAIVCAHRQGVLHLDIKPANILIDSQDQVKLADFGLAALHTDYAHADVQFGTPQFMSPEQAMGDKSRIGESSDIYSLGAVLYAALVGRPPIVAATTTELMGRVISQQPAPLRQFRQKIPVELEAIINKCLRKLPEERYQNAAALVTDLKAYLEGKRVLAPKPGLLQALRYQLQYHVVASRVSGTIVLMLVLLATWLFLKNVKQSTELQRLRDMEVQIVQQGQVLHGLASELSRRNQSKEADQLAAILFLLSPSTNQTEKSRDSQRFIDLAGAAGIDTRNHEALTEFAEQLIAPIRSKLPTVSEHE